MSDVHLEICRQIKAGIDAAREAGVYCEYPQDVCIDDQWYAWPL